MTMEDPCADRGGPRRDLGGNSLEEILAAAFDLGAIFKGKIRPAANQTQSEASGGREASKTDNVVDMAGRDAAPAVGGNLEEGELEALVKATFIQGTRKASLAASQASVKPLEASLHTPLKTPSHLEADTLKTEQRKGNASKGLEALASKRRTRSLRAGFDAVRKFGADTAPAQLKERLARRDGEVEAALRVALDALSQREDVMIEILESAAGQAAATAVQWCMALKATERRQRASSLRAAFGAVRKLALASQNNSLAVVRTIGARKNDDAGQVPSSSVETLVYFRTIVLSSRLRDSMLLATPQWSDVLFVFDASFLAAACSLLRETFSDRRRCNRGGVWGDDLRITAWSCGGSEDNGHEACRPMALLEDGVAAEVQCPPGNDDTLPTVSTSGARQGVNMSQGTGVDPDVVIPATPPLSLCDMVMHHADNNWPAQQSAASSITAAEGQQLFAVLEVRATTDLEGVLPEGVVPLEVTGALPCTSPTLSTIDDVDGINLDETEALTADTTDSEGSDDSLLFLPKDLNEDLKEGVGLEPWPGGEEDGEAAATTPEVAVWPVGLISPEPGVGTSGAEVSGPVFVEAATVELSAANQRESSFREAQRIQDPEHVEGMIWGMKHVMKEWDSRQITDTLGELMTYPGAAAAVLTPPEMEMATVRQDEKPGAYPYRTETGERPDADPIKRERDLEEIAGFFRRLDCEDRRHFIAWFARMRRRIDEAAEDLERKDKAEAKRQERDRWRKKHRGTGGRNNRGEKKGGKRGEKHEVSKKGVAAGFCFCPEGGLTRDGTVPLKFGDGVSSGTAATSAAFVFGNDSTGTGQRIETSQLIETVQEIETAQGVETAPAASSSPPEKQEEETPKGMPEEQEQEQEQEEAPKRADLPPPSRRSQASKRKNSAAKKKRRRRRGSS